MFFHYHLIYAISVRTSYMPNNIGLSMHEGSTSPSFLQSPPCDPFLIGLENYYCPKEEQLIPEKYDAISNVNTDLL